MTTERLFLQDAGIEYKDVLYEYGEKWEKQKDEVKLNLTGSLPVLDIDGHRLSQVTIPPTDRVTAW